MVVDFYADTGNVESQTAWFWPVFRYEVSYDTFEDTIAAGVMSLAYEDHALHEDHVSRVADYTFWCVVDSNKNPIRRTGGWMAWNPPPGCPTAPDRAFRPLDKDTTYHDVNPYLNYDEIKRVIDHTTIVMDDPFADSIRTWGLGSWVRRPGFADSCWGAFEEFGMDNHAMYWSPRLGRDGLWSLYVWKTNPSPGDGWVDRLCSFVLGSSYGYIDQADPPYGAWELVLAPSYLTVGKKTLVLDDHDRWPSSCCFIYFDAFKLEYAGGGGEGGASSAAVVLGEVSLRVRVAPNPVRRTAHISYIVSNPGPAEVVVYDVMGRSVLRAAQGIQRAGLQTAAISVAGLPTGTYVARVTAKGTNATCRFVVCR